MSIAHLVAAASGWQQWSLPETFSTHGPDVDRLFWATMWITVAAMVGVFATLIVFLIRYRSRPDRKKGYFTHGNTRLEMFWTLAPAVILAGLAVWNKGVWDRMRFYPPEQSAQAARVLVIGQQFKWNIVYPGPDGELGRYLIYPDPSDPTWPDGKPHQGVPGPAYLPEDQARSAIARYIDGENPLGKDFSDPKGLDDDYAGALARDMIIPVNRPVEVHLSSKDVIHDFFLPNFRVKLDAVPGMRGVLQFTATKTSREREEETRRTVAVADLIKEFEAKPNLELNVSIPPETPGAVFDTRARQWLYQETTGDKPGTIIRDGRLLGVAALEKLAANNIETITVYAPGYWEIVCEELCGMGHNTMTGRLIVVDQDEYARRFEGRTDTDKEPVAAANDVIVD